MRDDIRTFRPRDHLKYLEQVPSGSEDASEGSLSPRDRKGPRHNRFPSNATDKSGSTIIAPVQPIVDLAATSPPHVVSPLGDYSANLAKFIQSQLNSIPSYRSPNSSTSPCSCPDLGFHPRSPPLSPRKSFRHIPEAPHVIEIPAIRPPLKSAFSAWSSTDDETDDEVPPLPDNEPERKDSKPDFYTPSVLRYYETSSNSSFLLSSTPLEEEEQPDTAKGFSFPNPPHSPELSNDSFSNAYDGDEDDDYPPSASPTRPQLTSSSAPSFSSTSTGSYFDCKRPISFTPQLRDRIIAAVTPPPQPKIIPAISPFEGAALANIHDVLVESQQRVLVDGMSFDMLKNLSLPDEGMHRIQTSC